MNGGNSHDLHDNETPLPTATCRLPTCILAPTHQAARAVAARHFSSSLDSGLILAPDFAASEGWREVLGGDSGALLPRIATPREYFLEAATFELPDAPRWVTPPERRFLLREILPSLRRRLKYLSRLTRSADLVRQLDVLIADLREANLHHFEFGGDWGADLRLIVAEYNRRLQESGSVDIECAPRLWAEFQEADGRRQTAVNDEQENPASCLLPPADFVVYDQLLAPSPAQWSAMRALTSRAPSTLALVVVPWMDARPLENWDDIARLVAGSALERVLALWRESGAMLEIANEENSDAARAAAINAFFGHHACDKPENVTLTACHTPRAEIELVASHARARCQSPSQLEECALVLPNVVNYAGVLEASFRQHGVPLEVLRSRPLTSYPVVARVLRLLELAGSEWTLDEIADLFGDGLLRACCEDDVLDVARLRRACVESRSASLLDLEACRARWESAHDFLSARKEHLDIEKLEHDLDCLRALKQQCDDCDGELSAHQWKNATLTIIANTTCHLETSTATWASEAYTQVLAVRDAIERVAFRAARWLGDATRRGADFRDWLRLELESGSEESPSDDFCGAAVHVVSPSRLISHVPAVVYFAGMSETDWPASLTPGTLFLRHRSELALLRAHRGEPASWAQYQLALCVREAREVHLLHPTLQNGREVLRSPLLEDAALCWPGLPSLLLPELPTSRAALLQTLGEATRANADFEFHELPPELSSLIDTGQLSTLARLHRARHSADEIGIYDGALMDDGGADLVRQYFAAISKTLRLDATKLKTYAQCPLKWFFREVLYLRGPGELSDDLAGHQSGTLIHKILENFTRSHAAHWGDNGDETWYLMQETARYEIGRSGVREILCAAETRRLLGAAPDKPGGVLGAFLREESAQQSRESARPAWSTALVPYARSGFELPKQLSESLEARFELEIGGHKIIGVFDRIDIAPDGSVAAVVDYKTERGEPADFDRCLAGLDFQLPLYLLAARDIFCGEQNAAHPLLASSYFHIRSARYINGIGQASTLGRKQNKRGEGGVAQKNGRELEQVEFENWLAQTQKRVAQIGDLISQGQFNLSLHDRKNAGCQWCEYSTICARDDAVIAQRQRAFAGSEYVYFPQSESADSSDVASSDTEQIAS